MTVAIFAYIATARTHVICRARQLAVSPASPLAATIFTVKIVA
jgi:hypothetical protein